ncbi:C2H2-type zinc finger protein [Candidatus Sororendozoicomonas aggregata]|uniref:C2H2-type zinc finger protein n=1 Tax=Candidatus Sororendozoicomonas aggregata TaxID=3073239 RepID=UPI002ED03B8B
MPKDNICGYCGSRFETSYKLKIHIRTHTGDKPHRCKSCGRGFAQQSALTVHIRTHTGEKPHKCDTCGKVFARPCTLKVHMRSHTGERPYVCAACGKSYTQRAGLNRHKCGIQTRFDCPVCSEKCFSSDKAYEAHMIEEHPDYHEHELSISPPRQPQASTRYARSPSEVSINQQTIPGVGTICAVTHTMTSLATGIVTTASRISGPSGETVVFTQTRTTARSATATSTATGPGTSAASAQPYPVEIAAVAQQAPEPSFFVPGNPLEVPIMDFDDLSNAWVGDEFPW